MTNVWVYKADGTLQCGEGKEITLEEMKKELASLIGEKGIISCKKRTLPMFIPQVCGAPTGQVNTYEITEEGAYVLFHGFVGPKGFALWIWPVSAGKQGPISPWPFSRGLKGEREEDAGALFLNYIASVTHVGATPIFITELLGRICRCYTVGDPLTKDYIPQRVNIEKYPDSTIARIWFG